MRLPDTNINQRFGDKSLIRIRMRDSDRTMSVDWPLFQTLSYSPKLPNPFYLCFQFSIYEVVYLDGEITLVLVTNLFSPKVNNVVYSYKWSVVILRSPDEFLNRFQGNLIDFVVSTKQIWTLWMSDDGVPLVQYTLIER